MVEASRPGSQLIIQSANIYAGFLTASSFSSSSSFHLKLSLLLVLSLSAVFYCPLMAFFSIYMVASLNISSRANCDGNVAFLSVLVSDPSLVKIA